MGKVYKLQTLKNNMKIEITEKELNEIFKDKILEHMKNALDDNMLEYWVRGEIHKIIAKDVVENLIKKNYPDDKLKEILKESFETYIKDKYSD